MKLRPTSLLGLMTLASALALPSLAMAQQPLAVVVNPITTVAFAPFSLLPIPQSGDAAFATQDSFGRETNIAAAEAAAVGYTADGLAEIPAPVLRQVGPRYTNPAGYNRRAVVLRRGSPVPAYVATANARNLNVAGLVPNASYEYFISPENRIVFVDPASRRVVGYMR